MKPALYFVILLFGCHQGAANPPLYSNRGQVTIASATFRSGTVSYTQASVSAGFLRAVPDPEAGCTKSAYGDCEIVECGGVVTGPPPDGGASVYVSAGNLALSGARLMAKLEVITSGMFIDQYPITYSNTPLFSAGDALTANAPGAVAPAFTATVTAPAQPTMTAPVRPMRGALVIPRSSDFKLAWSGGGPGRVQLSLAVMPPSDMGVAARTGLSCSFANANNAGTIPSAALRALPAGSGNLYVAVGNRARVESAGWTMDLGAVTLPVDAIGQPWD
jgi:hypothetical protein